MCRQRSIRRKICPRDQSLLQVRKSKLSQPLQNFLRQSQVLIHNGRKVPISFDASSEDPTPLKGCVLWNRRTSMVRIMASAKDTRRGLVWSCEEQIFERDVEAFG